MHKAIREGLEEGVDEIQVNGARQLREGWMHVHGASLQGHPHSLSKFGYSCTHTPLDERNIPPLGRIGDPDDIIASVRVQDGRVSFPVADTDWIWELIVALRR